MRTATDDEISGTPKSAEKISRRISRYAEVNVGMF
jgi:hypothetical protein